MRRKLILICLGVVLAVVLAAIILNQVYNPSSAISSSEGSAPGVAITYSNLASELSKNYLVQALPEGSIIALKFYNFDSGARQWEKSYVLTTGHVEEGSAESADITLSLHSNYMEGLTSTNFCSVIQTANKNKDLGFESSLSTFSLLWKFKSVWRYKSCFGM